MTPNLSFIFRFSILVVSISVVRSQMDEGSSSFDGQIDSTFFMLKANLEKVKQKSSTDLIALSHLELGEFYRKTGVYSEAMDQYNKAIEFIDSNTNDSLYAILNNSIGKVHLSLNKFELAKQFFDEGLRSSNNLGYIQGQAVSKGLIGSCFEKRGEYLQALNYQKRSLELFVKLGNDSGISMVNENIGSIYEDLGQYDRAYEYFTKSYEYSKDKSTREEANVLNNLGDIYRKQGDYIQSIHYTQMALEVADRLQDNHQLESGHKDLSKAYALLGNFKEAHKHLLEAEKYNKAWLLAQNANQLNVLQTIFETNKKEAQIQLLKEQNKVNRANQNLLWVALFAIAAILTILYSYVGRKRKAKLKLQEYRQRTLKAELEKKKYEEKNLQREIKLKTAALSRYSLHLSQKNKILLDLSNTLRNIASRKNMDSSIKIKDLAKEIDFNLRQEHEWDEFMNFFKEIHPDFIKKLSALSESNLSPAEMRLGMLLRLNLTSKEIASILRVTPDSVRVARYRLRKKLPIDQKEELVNFMVEL